MLLFRKQEARHGEGMESITNKSTPAVRRFLTFVLAGAAFAAACVVAVQASMLTLATVTSSTHKYSAGGIEQASHTQVEVPGEGIGALVGGGSYPVGAEIAVTPTAGGWAPADGLVAAAAGAAGPMPWVLVASLSAAGVAALLIALWPGALRRGPQGSQD